VRRKEQLKEEKQAGREEKRGGGFRLGLSVFL